MIIRFFLASAALLLTTLSAFGDTPSTLAANPKKNFTIVGSIKYQHLEGGSYVIVSRDGTVYEPLNLAPLYEEPGLKVRVRARLSNEATIYMVGYPIRIIRISLR